MKYPTIYIIILFSILPFICLGQEYKFTYEINWKKYDCRPNNNYHGYSTLLVKENSSSIYFDASNLNGKVEYKGSSVSSSSLGRVFDYAIYKYKDSLKLFQPIASNVYYYQEKRPTIDWQIKEDTATILGYLCQKAVGIFSGKTYEVWFTEEIPISNGPDKFGGLPGLIFRIEDSEKKISFRLNEITPLNAETTSKNAPIGIKLLRKDFYAREADYFINRKNYMTGIINNSMTFTVRNKKMTVDEFFEDIKNDYLCLVKID
jgi:GLPGLI family protein